MKNFRKIVAILAMVLMLFSVLPLSAFADPGVISIDDIQPTATSQAVVGQIINGDFETGDATAWEIWQSTEINASAAHDGTYGAHLIGNGGWGGMLNQDIPVEAGKTYEITLWIKVISNGVNFQIKDGGTSGANLDSRWFTATEWTQLTFTVIPTTDIICLNFCGGGIGVAEDLYVDDIVVKELKDPSDDGFVKNGDFETGKGSPWTLYSGSNVSADAAYTGDYGLICTNPNGGWGGTAFQDFSVEIGKSYEVTMWAKAIAQGQSIQIKNGGANVAFNWFNKTEWTLLTFEFTATATDVRINICGGGTGVNEMVYFDDIKVKKLIDPSFDGYIYNGDFETGKVFPWDNLWGSNTVEIVEGMDGYGLHIVSGQWRHVRQTNIAVEPNTDYKITAWAKNTKDMCLLVKDGGDIEDMVMASVDAGDEWTEFTAEFNSGNNTTILFSLMGNSEEAYGTFDNVSIVKMAPTIWVSTSEATAGDEIEVQVKLLNNPGVIAATVEILYDKDVMELVTYFDEEEEMWLPQIEVGAIYNAASNKYITFGPIDDETGIARKCVVSYIRGTAKSNCDKEDFFTATFRIKENAPCGTYPLTVSYAPQNFFAMGYVDVAFGKQDGSVTITCAHADWDPCTGICPDCGMAVKPAHGNIIAVDAKDATCTEDGNVAYWYCDACGQVWLDEARTLNTTPEAVILPALGHAFAVHIAARPSTCTENGNIEYWYCADCDKAWLDGNYTLPISLKAVFLPLEDHTYDDKYDAGCNVCGHIREVPVRPIFGDASGDGVVNGRDMALLQQYMADWDVIMDKAAADVNDNGVINARDVALLQQYIAGWDVKLG